MKCVDRIFLRVIDGTMIIASTALALMLVHVSLNVLARVILNKPIEGTLEITAFYYMVAAVMSAVAYLERRNLQLTVDLLYSQFPLSLRRAIYILTALLTAAFFGLLSYRGAIDALYAMKTQEMIMGMTQIEIWPSRFILPISSALVVLSVLRNVLKVATSPFYDPVNTKAESLE